jgi:hypothetical protein
MGRMQSDDCSCRPTGSMNDLIKSCKLIHNLIMGVCAAIIAFALTPDPAETYRAALGEIQAVQSMKRESYSNYALKRLAARRQELAEFEKMPFTSRGRSFVLNKYTIEPEVYVSWPDTDAKVIDIIQFFEGDNKAVEYGPGDERELEAAARTAQKDPKQIPLPKSAFLADASFLAPSEVATVKVGDRLFLAKGLPYEQFRGRLALDFRDTPNGDIHTFSRYGPSIQNVSTYEIDDVNLAGEWLARESGIYDRISKTTGPKSATIFPNLKAARSEIEAQSLAGAARVLQDKLDSTKREIRFLGLTVEERIAVWVGPTTLLLLLLYFYAHISTLNRRRFTSDEGLQNAAWIVLFPGLASSVLSYASIIALPPIAAAALLERSGHLHEWTTRLGLALSLAVIVVAVLCAWKIAPMRIKRPEDNTI